MFSLRVEKESGASITLTGNETHYQVVKITGLNPPPAVVNMATVAGQDGAQFNSSRLNTRNIVLTIRINGDVEANRLALYNYFQTKEFCKVVYENDTRSVFADGYVESVECDYFTNSEQVQVSIICPNSYWQKTTETIVTLPANVTNNSEDDTGFVAEIEFNADASSFSLSAQSGIYYRQMSVSYNFRAGDVLTINTRKGQKSIMLRRDYDDINLLSALGVGETFVQLFEGYNQLNYGVGDADPADANVTLTFREQYRGV